MKDWGAVIDTGSRVLTLKDPQGEDTFQVPLPRRTDLISVTCATEVIPIHQIPKCVSFQMYSQMSYLVFRQIGILNLELS